MGWDPISLLNVRIQIQQFENQAYRKGFEGKGVKARKMQGVLKY
jgi:hypothetical protein